MIFGMGIACLVIVGGVWITIIMADRKADRHFDAWVAGMDAGRDKAWRELGVSEETIALYYIKREEMMKENTRR